jgi:hypothetical protein
VNKTDPPPPLKFKNIRGNCYKKNLEIFKIPGSRAELLDFDFEIDNFFENRP